MLRTSWVSVRFCSDFVSRIRYVNRLKENAAECSEALQNADVFLFHRLTPLLQRSQQGTFTPATLCCSDLRPVLDRLGSKGALLNDSVLLGCSEQNQVQFCLDVGELDRTALEELCGGTFMDLKKSFFLLTEPHAPLLAKAQALLRWHQTHGFCSATGKPTHRNQAGSHRVCRESGTVYYPKSSPVVIVLVSDGSRCLLARQPAFPRGMYSALAGFCDLGETLEETLVREVGEEVGLGVQDLVYSSSQHWPFPQSSLMIGCHASVSPAHTQVSVDRGELEDARWFGLDDITAALEAPPTKGVWLPPKHAIARRLIEEWAELQRRGQEGP